MMLISSEGKWEMTQHTFGGDWTESKLERLRKYLHAYTTIMKKQNLKCAYVDAFAGTGGRATGATEDVEILEKTWPLFSNLDEDTEGFLDGSARIALNTKPEFDKYIFVEKDSERYKELTSLQKEFPALSERIEVHNEESNSFLLNLCSKDWRRRRAVLFLDPYGMQVEWKTVEAVAKTKAIDMWLLFPLGVAVNRLLRRDGNIPDSIKKRLDKVFGTEEWFERFYDRFKTTTLLTNEPSIETWKKAGFKNIADFYLERLRSVFAGVAENPLYLCNTVNCPIFLLYFAASNPKGAPTAVKIAEDILSR